MAEIGIGDVAERVSKRIMEEVVAPLKKQNEKLRSALEFYADQNTWHKWDGDRGDVFEDDNQILEDRGSIARSALEADND